MSAFLAAVTWSAAALSLRSFSRGFQVLVHVYDLGTASEPDDENAGGTQDKSVDPADTPSEALSFTQKLLNSMPRINRCSLPPRVLTQHPRLTE